MNNAYFKLLFSEIKREQPNLFDCRAVICDRQRTSIFGRNLRMLRQDRGLTLKVVADMMDRANHSSLVSWELGRTYPNVRDFAKLCKIYNVTPNDLLGF